MSDVSEIDRMRGEIAQWKEILLFEIIANEIKGQHIERLQQRIEELEEKQRTIDVIDHIGLIKSHIITTEQIVAAWKAATRPITEENRRSGWIAREAMLNILRFFGIVRCDGCDGVGDREPTEMYQSNGDPTDPTWIECSECNGHGWIIKNDRTKREESNGQTR